MFIDNLKWYWLVPVSQIVNAFVHLCDRFLIDTLGPFSFFWMSHVHGQQCSLSWISAATSTKLGLRLRLDFCLWFCMETHNVCLRIGLPFIPRRPCHQQVLTICMCCGIVDCVLWHIWVIIIAWPLPQYIEIRIMGLFKDWLQFSIIWIRTGHNAVLWLAMAVTWRIRCSTDSSRQPKVWIL